MKAFGIDTRGHSSHLYKVMGVAGYFLNRDQLFPFLTPMQNMTLFSKLKGVPAAEVEASCTALLEKFALTDCANVTHWGLTKLQKRKLYLAMSLIGDPLFLVWDMPFKDLDTKSIAMVISIITELQRNGKTFLIGSDEATHIEKIADRVMISYGGKTKAVGDIFELRTSLEGHYGQNLLKLIKKRFLNPNARRDERESPRERRASLDEADPTAVQKEVGPRLGRKFALDE